MVRCGGPRPRFFYVLFIRRAVPKTACRLKFHRCTSCLWGGKHMNKRAGRTNLRANHIAIAVAAAFAPWSLHAQTPPAPNTLPTGGVITHGSGTINAPVQAGTVSTMQIDQTSARMAAQFGSFSIGQSAHVNVTQPSSSSIALFKDVGGNVSQIFGLLTANGQLFVSNPDGVPIGRTGRVAAAGFIATTLSLDANEFMPGGHSINSRNNGTRGRG